MMNRVLILALAALALASIAPASTASADGSTVDLQLLSLSAWNGEVAATTTATGDSGGAAAITAYWEDERAANPNTLALGTGNSFGTSPPISNLFEDEPAIRAMNAIGFDADTLGNDNFDHGIAYLQRLLTMADFPFLSANLTHLDENLPGVRPFRVFELDGVKVAVIGLTDPRSPSVVFPGNFGTLEVTNPSIAAYQAREAAAREGAQVFVLVTELVLTNTSPAAGPLIDLASTLSGFDVILGNGETANFSATINGTLVVAGKNRGQSYARTNLRFDTESGSVVASTVQFVEPLVARVTPSAELEALVDVYRAQLHSRLSEVIGSSATAVAAGDLCGQAAGRSCESLTGNVVADAMRSTYGTEIALVNAGSLRAGVTCPAIDSATDFCPAFKGLPAPITEGQVQAILPFTNFATTATISGAELKAMLENGVSMIDQSAGRFPQVSGFCFWYEIAQPVGSRVLSAVLQGADGGCSGARVDFGSGASYTLVTNDFVAAGGDGYAKPTATTVTRERLDIVLSRYLRAQNTITPRAEDRINCIGSGCPQLLFGSTLPLPAGAAAVVRPPSTGDGGLRP